mgnify:CR=1 FL=1
MSVATHLGIRLDEYDARIRTFIPGYEQMLDAAAHALRALPVRAPTIVDLGTGTGALAARCLDVRSDATVTGIDADPAILDAARRRLEGRGGVASFVQSDYLAITIPDADAVVASLALHHVRTAARKRRLYRDCRQALRPAGLLISADCFPSRDAELAALEREAWRAHLRRAYSEAETDAYFAAWAAEDVYMPLEDELAMLRDARLEPDVIWRVAPFGVVAARAR